MNREEPLQQYAPQSHVLGTSWKATSQSPAAVPWPISSTGHAPAQHGALGEPRLCCLVHPCLHLSWSLQHQLLCYVHYSCSWKQAAATSQATVPPSWSWGSPGDHEGVRKWPFPVSSAFSALPERDYSTCSHRDGRSRCLPLPANPPEASKQPGTPALAATELFWEVRRETARGFRTPTLFSRKAVQEEQTVREQQDG